MKKILFIILTIPFIAAAGIDESNNPGNGRIEGSVREEGVNTPVEFANVVLFNAKDSTMVTGGLTNPDGSFTLENIPEGDYYVTVHLIGFEQVTLSGIKLTRDRKHLDIGDIKLGMTAFNLQEAEIVAEKMAIEYKLDRKVVNVGDDISSTGGTAVEVLEKTPSVSVDVDGTVYLRGSSNFTVLIDGKPSVLKGSEALQQIPANTIDNIEIITNPSVRYDPDGESGIINIKLKKVKLQGLSGQASVTAGTGEKYGTDLYLNYKVSDWNFFGGVEWNDRRAPGSGEELRETYLDDTTFTRDAKLNGAWLRNGLTFKAGIDYNLNERITLSLGGEYSDYGFGMDNFQNVHEYSAPSLHNYYYLQSNSMRWTRNYYVINTNYLQKFSQEGHQMSLYLFFTRNWGLQAQDNRQTDTDENWNPDDTQPTLIRSFEEGPSNQARVEFNYTKPVLTKGKLEAGYTYRFDNETEDYRMEDYDVDRNEWIPNDEYYKESRYISNIHAVYGMFSHEIAGFQYQAGLRGEYTYRDVTVTNTGESAIVDRFDYYPSLHISKKLKEKNQFQLSYSRRVQRPNSWYLEPYVTYVNETTRWEGNPSLLPEFTGSYELGYIRSLPAGTTTVEGYVRNTQEKITQTTTFDETTGLYRITWDNLNDDRATGLEWSLMYDITKWFNLNVSATYYYYQLKDKSEEAEVTRTSNNWDSKLITQFKLPTKTRLQLNFSYLSPTVTYQGRAEESYHMDVSVRQEFLKSKLNATVTLADVFATRNRTSYTYGDNFYIYDSRNPESRVLTVTMSYRLNNFKVQPQRNNDAGSMM